MKKLFFIDILYSPIIRSTYQIHCRHASVVGILLHITNGRFLNEKTDLRTLMQCYAPIILYRTQVYDAHVRNYIYETISVHFTVNVERTHHMKIIYMCHLTHETKRFQE